MIVQISEIRESKDLPILLDRFKKFTDDQIEVDEIESEGPIVLNITFTITLCKPTGFNHIKTGIKKKLDSIKNLNYKEASKPLRIDLCKRKKKGDL
jgi:hypothetical protein